MGKLFFVVCLLEETGKYSLPTLGVVSRRNIGIDSVEKYNIQVCVLDSIDSRNYKTRSLINTRYKMRNCLLWLNNNPNVSQIEQYMLSVTLESEY